MGNLSKIKSFSNVEQQKVVLLVEPCLSSSQLIIQAKENGLSAIIITADSDQRKIPAPILEKAPLVLVVDTNKQEDVLSLVKTLVEHVQIDAVVPGAEYYVPLTAKIAEILNKKALTVEASLNARRKDLMRDALKKAGVLIPNYRVIHSAEGLTQALSEIGYPCIIKPVDFAGSVNVKKVDTYEQALEAYTVIFNGGKFDPVWGNREIRPEILLEEYISGSEYSVEGFLVENEVSVVSVTEKILSPEPDFIEVGHIVTSQPDAELKAILKDYITQVSRGLGLNIGPFHAEIRLSDKGPVLMEIAMRLAGDYIPKLIYYATGINYYLETFKVFLGERLSLEKSKNLNAGITFFYRPEIKQIKTTRFFEELLDDEMVIEACSNYAVGDSVPSNPLERRKLGRAIVVDENMDLVREKLKHLEEKAYF